MTAAASARAALPNPRGPVGGCVAWDEDAGLAAWYIAVLAEERDPMPKTDTAPAAAEAQAGVLRRLDPERRLELAVDMSIAARGLLASRLRTEHMEWPEAMVHREVLRLSLDGADLPPHPHGGG